MYNLRILISYIFSNYSNTPKRVYLLHLLFALVISSHTEDLPCDLACSKRPSKVLIQKQIMPLYPFVDLYGSYGILLLQTLHTL